MVGKINKRGFTLTELLVAMAIMGIMLSVATLSYLKWKTKTNIENDIKKIYSILQKYRVRAFSEKESFTCSFSSDGKTFYVRDSGGNLEESLTLDEAFAFKSSNITIDSRGTFSGSAIKPSNTSAVPQYNCISVDDTRIKLGQWNSGSNNCNVQ